MELVLFKRNTFGSISLNLAFDQGRAVLGRVYDSQTAGAQGKSAAFKMREMVVGYHFNPARGLMFS